MNAVRRVVTTLTILSTLSAGIRPVSAQDWSYAPAAPVGYPAPYQSNNHDVLKKVLVGGVLVGLGFLAGRLTAPRPNYGYGYNYAPQGPQIQPPFGQPAFYGSYHGPHGHRF